MAMNGSKDIFESLDATFEDFYNLKEIGNGK